MICLLCDNEEFAVKLNAEIEQVFRGKSFKVITPAMVCIQCGWVTLGSGQLDELYKRTKDAYFLLTSTRETDTMKQEEQDKQNKL